MVNFYPRSPCGERPLNDAAGDRAAFISIHALLAESDPARFIAARASRHFYPRSPCGERLVPVEWMQIPGDFYPRSPCGERRADLAQCVAVSRFLSTLSLRRATTCRQEQTTGHPGFLSTLSLRRATVVPVEWMQIPGDFYPRSPCGERRDARAAMKRAGMISIHALLAESDGQCPPYHGDSLQFLSTLSLRRATSQCRTFASGIYGFLSTLSLRRATA